jgi:hypothetical protein
MKIIKRITHRVELIDPNNIFSPDIENVCLKILEETFLNRCYKSCYITKINSILNRSNIYIKNELDGGAYTNVNFEVEGIVYQKGDLINDCKIIKIESNGITHGTTKNAGVQFRQNPAIYETGDLVPIIVKAIRYNPYADQMTIYAKPFKPALCELFYYKLTGEIADDDKKEITNIFDKIKDLNNQIKKMPKLNNNILSLLNIVTYPLKKQQVLDGHETVTFDIKKIMLDKSEVIITEGNPRYMDPVYFHVKETKNLIFIMENRGVVYKTLLYNHFNRLETLVDFSKSYSSKKDLQDSTYIKKTYRK